MRMRMIKALLLSAVLLTAGSAHALGWNLRLDPGAAFPLDTPRKQAYTAGGAIQVAGGIQPLKWLDLHLALGFIGMDPRPTSGLGTEWNITVGGGVRLQLPRDWDSVVFPWVEGDVEYVRSVDRDLFAFAVAAGIVTPLDEQRRYFIGPFVRYVQMVEPSPVEHSKTIIAGLSFEFGSPNAAAKPAPADRDGDGVTDDRDRCPDQAGPASNQGCPVPPPPPAAAPADRDHDGIADANDACPDQPGTAELKGCPDRDHDGLADADDACPDQAGTAEMKGCPDRDHDGVADNVDNCPDKAGPVSNQGCPEYKEVKVTKNKLEISQKIYFATNKSTILKKSFGILDEIAKVLSDNPSIKLRIEGHTDSTGNAQHNQQLSEARAGAVRSYLVKKKIAADRLEAKGYGSTRPIADNQTPAGRDQNRRVEFVVVSQ